MRRGSFLTCHFHPLLRLTTEILHDLYLQNLSLLKELVLIDEVSIGHAIISESLDRGFKNTIQQYINLING